MLEGIVELGNEVVMQIVHYFHLTFHIATIASLWNAHKFGSQLQVCCLLPAFVDGSEFSPAMDSFFWLN